MARWRWRHETFRHPSLSLPADDRPKALTGRLRMIAARTFRYARTSSLERLLEQARSRHYSTFSLYAEAGFEKACQTFEDAVRRQFHDPAKVAWRDQNILLQIGRTDA